MVELCEELRFAFEPCQTLAVGRECGGQHLDGDVALELRIARAVNLAHATRTHESDDFIRADSCPSAQRHRSIRNLALRQSANLPMPRVSAADSGVPMPPEPTRAMTSYEPIRVPALSAIVQSAIWHSGNLRIFQCRASARPTHQCRPVKYDVDGPWHCLVLSRDEEKALSVRRGPVPHPFDRAVRGRCAEQLGRG